MPEVFVTEGFGPAGVLEELAGDTGTTRENRTATAVAIALFALIGPTVEPLVRRFVGQTPYLSVMESSGPIRAQRLGNGPIIRPSDRIGTNINGPSLIAAPPWIDQPEGRFYLYFAHHLGDHIRFASADDLLGPWRIRDGGVLHLRDSLFPVEPVSEGELPAGCTAHFPWHIASPDVHVDEERQEVRMYFHGLADLENNQRTRLAISKDGLQFETLPEILCPSYLRAFRHDGAWYGIAQVGTLYRSSDGIAPFERGPQLWPGMRHGAICIRGTMLHWFYSRWGDAPERILCSSVELSGDWRTWTASEPVEVLAPLHDWEGASLPIKPSQVGATLEELHELRDPAIFENEDDGKTYLLYSVAGESGIAIAELTI